MAVYAVPQVLGYLKDLLNRESLLQDLWVQGEVANLARAASGHFYFSLRDSDATLRCAMFRGAFGPPLGADLLSEGANVVAHGRVSLYEARGDLQFVADMVKPEGVGELQLKLEELKLRLRNEGLFEPSRKRPIPAFPHRLGVVTSPDGAVWQDIQTVVERRYPLAWLLLAPTAVQGEAATTGILEAIAALDRISNVDVIIVARGGGSLEDLWAFNDESVARAIFSSRAPVISAVGHETDVTIADMVADRRAPTPSAAAEMAVPDSVELTSRLAAARQTMTSRTWQGVAARLEAVRGLGPRLRRNKPDLDRHRLRVDELLDGVVKHLQGDVKLKGERVRTQRLRLEALSPKDTLRRGYAIVHAQADDSAIISDPSQVGAGDRVRITVARGGFGAEVLPRRKEPEGP